MAISKEDLKAVMSEIFEERARVSPHEHADHHEWIQERIQAEKSRKEMYFELTKTVMQWSVLGILGGLVYWVQNGHWPH